MHRQLLERGLVGFLLDFPYLFARVHEQERGSSQQYLENLPPGL